ncbi:hypothetical protein V6N13_001641 [Hibiscus sabdariffa]
MELEWNSQQDKDFEFPDSNFKSVTDKEDTLNTILSYSETDLIPVPVKSAVAEKGVVVIVANGVARKVRSVNDLVLNTGSEEQKYLLVKARGKSRQNKARTAVADVSQTLVSGLWPHDVFDFVFAPSVGASGGILVIWDCSRFQLELSEVLAQYVVLKGSWVHDSFPCGLAAVYAPCGVSDQLLLWESMGQFISARKDWSWCVAGDFNMACWVSERTGCKSIT